MEFSLPTSGSSYYSGGLPTGWQNYTASVGGGGAVPARAIPPGAATALITENGAYTNYANMMMNPDVLSGTKRDATSALNTVLAIGPTRNGDINAFRAALAKYKAISNSPYSYRPSDLVVDPAALGMGNIAGVSNMPADEAGLLQEYGNKVSVGSPYTGEIYNGANSQSAYNAWLKSQQDLYNAAKSGAGIEPDPNLPTPFMPNGAPKIDQPENAPEFPKLDPYNPLKSDWKGNYKVGDLSGLFGGNKNFNPFSKLASQYDSPSFTGSGLLAQTMAKGMEGAEPQKSSSNPWQSKNLIKPASYFDDSSQGIAPPKGLMGQDMITQNNVLPALQMALMNNQGMPEGDKALEAATKPLSDAKDKGNATDKIQEARDKWKSDSLNKFGNWQSLA